MICLGATGNAVRANAHGLTRAHGFFDLKGDVEAVLRAFELQQIRFETLTSERTKQYHPGRSARVIMDGKPVARFGQVHPDVMNALKIKQEIYLAEIDLDCLLQRSLRVPRYQPLSRFPAVDRDFSFLFDDSATFEQVSSAVLATKIAELQSFEPAEIFRGGGVPQGKYAVLLRARFQSPERTLRDDEVAEWSAQIIKALEGIGGMLRS